MSVSKNQLGDALIHIGKLIKEDKCQVSPDQCDEIFGQITSAMRVQMTAEQACSYLQCSRTSFDKWVKMGLLPKGKKIRGMSSLIWYKNELKRPE